MGVINTNTIQNRLKNYQPKNSHKLLNHGKPQMHDEGGEACTYPPRHYFACAYVLRILVPIHPELSLHPICMYVPIPLL